jgi:hypothetical protein
MKTEFENTITVFGKELLESVGEDKQFGYAYVDGHGNNCYAIVSIRGADLDKNKVTIRYDYDLHNSFLGWKQTVSIAKPRLHNRFFKHHDLDNFIIRLIKEGKLL